MRLVVRLTRRVIRRAELTALVRLGRRTTPISDGRVFRLVPVFTRDKLRDT